MDVHCDVRDIAGQAQPAAVGRQVEVFADVSAIELQRVGARLPFDDVAAITWIPDDDVIASSTQDGVTPATTNDSVVAVATNQDVIAIAADDRVVAGSAIHDEVDQWGQSVGAGEFVVTTVHVQDQVLSSADVQRERRR